jgi:uncharacterized protein with GYD domain
MAKYLVSVSYTPDGAKGLRKDGGTKRRHVATKAIQSVGGQVESFYFALGATDVIVIADLPDAVSVAGLSIAIAATGGARCTTTLLLTAEDIDRACEKKTAYKAPGA